MMKRIDANNILYCIAVLIIVYAFRGYEYASGDVVDVMAYAKHIQIPSLYENDFYVSHISSVFPNERYVFAHILSLSGRALTIMPFVLHLILTILFFRALFVFSSYFIQSRFLKWFMILVLLGPLYKYNLGGNELFYNMFIPSYAAKVIGLWALIYYMRRDFFKVFILILLSTYLHQTVGAQLFILIFASEMALWIFKGRQNYNKRDIIGFLLYLIAGLGYMIVVFKAVGDAGLSTAEYFELIKFRAAHHFFPSFFPLKSYFVEIILYFSGVLIMIKYRFWNLLRISIMIIAGLLLYTFAVEFLNVKIILSSQWYKTTIWLELFSLISLFAFIERRVLRDILAKIEKPAKIMMLIMSILILAMVVARVEYFKQKHHEFFYGMNLTPEEQLGLAIKNKTSSDDIFIYPVEFTGFKIYSERNAYVDFKSTVHRESVLPEWYKRIQEVYGISVKDRIQGKNLFDIAKYNYKNISKSKLNALYNKGVRYMVQYGDAKIDMPLIYDNSYFKVYKLKAIGK